jgi:hypothetical protein
VNDVVVLEAAHDVRDRVRLADVREELVAEAFALRGAGDESRDVDELDGRGNHFFRMRNRRKRCEARVGHFDDADVGIDRAKRVILGGDSGFGQRVEQRRLADVGQPDDPALQAHDVPLVCSICIARSKSPAATEGHAARARSIAASMCVRSADNGGRST